MHGKSNLTSAPTRGRGRWLGNVRCFSPVAVGRAVRWLEPNLKGRTGIANDQTHTRRPRLVNETEESRRQQDPPCQTKRNAPRRGREWRAPGVFRGNGEGEVHARPWPAR